MHTTSIRILLAIAMVLWSPAWCCCALNAGADGTLGEPTCSVASLCVTRAPATPAERLCCAADDAEQSPCTCSDRPSELNRLDTAPKLTVPLLTQCVFAVQDVVAFEVDDRHNPKVASRPCCEIMQPPSSSLFVQHCLLLI